MRGMNRTSKHFVREKAQHILSNSVPWAKAGAILDDLEKAGCMADAFRTTRQAKAAGQKSGMLLNGDTFGREF